MNRLQFQDVRGFTLVEFILVVAISSILILGLSAVIEAPRKMAEQRADSVPSVAAADLTLAQLDRDVRFALDVSVGDPKVLQLSQRDGNSVTYSWNGNPGSPLLRTDDDGTVAVLDKVQDLGFVVGTTPRRVLSRVSTTVQSSAKVASSFTTWNLKPGYVLGTALRGLIGVTTITGERMVAGTDTVGLFCKALNLSEGDAAPTAIRARMRRLGTDDVRAVVYETNPNSHTPNRGLVVAVGYVTNATLPVSTSEVTIPLTQSKKLKDNKEYFVELRSVGGNRAAWIEYEVLSLAEAAGAHSTALLVSTNGGANYASLAGVLDACQSRFGFEGVLSQVDVATLDDDDDDDGGGPSIPSPVDVVQIPTSVYLKLAVITPNGPADVKTSFPIENNLALVRQ